MGMRMISNFFLRCGVDEMQMEICPRRPSSIGLPSRASCVSVCVRRLSDRDSGVFVIVNRVETSSSTVESSGG